MGITVKLTRILEHPNTQPPSTNAAIHLYCIVLQRALQLCRPAIEQIKIDPNKTAVKWKRLADGTVQAEILIWITQVERRFIASVDQWRHWLMPGQRASLLEWVDANNDNQTHIERLRSLNLTNWLHQLDALVRKQYKQYQQRLKARRDTLSQPALLLFLSHFEREEALEAKTQRLKFTWYLTNYKGQCTPELLKLYAVEIEKHVKAHLLNYEDEGFVMDPQRTILQISTLNSIRNTMVKVILQITDVHPDAQAALTNDCSWICFIHEYAINDAMDLYKPSVEQVADMLLNLKRKGDCHPPSVENAKKRRQTRKPGVGSISGPTGTNLFKGTGVGGLTGSAQSRTKTAFSAKRLPA